MKVCSISECGKKRKAKGLCSMHYQVFKAHGDPEYERPVLKCSVPGCGNKYDAQGYCSTHYGRLRKHGDPRYVPPPYVAPDCQITGCGKKVKAKGFCPSHYDSLRNNGVPEYARPPFIDPGCKVPGCGRDHKGKGFCVGHLRKFLEYGDPLHSVPAAREEQKWVGDLRVCSCCGNHKTPENFYPHSGTGRLVDKCKKCISDKGKLRSYEELRCKNLKQNYNLTHEEWLTINEAQNGVCAICRKPEMRTGRPLSVDHDHETSKIRGLLCGNCNTALGLLKDSIPNLSSAIEYLKRTGSDSGTQK